MHRESDFSEAARIKTKLEKHFTSTPSPCPYNLPGQAIYRQAGFSAIMPESIMAAFLNSGYRRNGNTLYKMTCQDCAACIPIRLKPAEFTPSRSQKRVLRRNRDITIKIAPLRLTEEKFSLGRKFLKTRYPASEGTVEEYYSNFFINSLGNTFEVQYHRDGNLVGVGIIDLGTSWLNCVYFYFDPAEKKCSLGTYNILSLIDFCRQNDIDFLYLGYWLKEVRAMAYKAAFRPHALLLDGVWQEQATGNTPKKHQQLTDGGQVLQTP